MRNKTKARANFSDGDVIDKRAVRTNQVFVFMFAVAGFFSPIFWLLIAIQLLIGVIFGRKFCLPCLFYYKVIQPRFGEGEIEDSAPTRFSNKVGLVFLLAAFAFTVAGLEAFGAAAATVVIFLSLIGFSTGFCLGCFLFKISAKRIKKEGIKNQRFFEQTVIFSHPLCSGCLAAEKMFPDAEVVNIKTDPGLKKDFQISVVPTIYRFDKQGQVIEKLVL